jgi:hypothetical protein
VMNWFRRKEDDVLRGRSIRSSYCPPRFAGLRTSEEKNWYLYLSCWSFSESCAYVSLGNDFDFISSE